MWLLVIGIVVFFGIHTLPWKPAMRDELIQNLGEMGYKGLFTLVSLAGFALILYGKGMSNYVPLWPTPSFAGAMAASLMLPAFYLIAAAYLPSNIKRYTRHPMLWGVTLWGVSHLVANGDLASVLLFGSFTLYALLDMVSSNRRGAMLSEAAVAPLRELIPVAIAVMAFIAVRTYHGTLFGVPLAAA